MAQTTDMVRTVRELVQQRIFRGEWPEGFRIDEEALRRENNATVRAVRSALQELTESGLLSRKQRLGTFVARKTKPGSVQQPVAKVSIVTSLLGVELTSNPYFKAVATGIRQSLSPAAEIIIHSNHGSSSFDIQSLPPLQYAALREESQGLIAVEANNMSSLNQLVGAEIPVVSVDFGPSGALFDSVCVDHERAGYLATEHLLSLGHRTVAFIGERPNFKSSDPTWQERATGYLRAMAEKSNMGFQKWWLNIGRSEENIQVVLPEFHRSVKPTAYVLCAGNLLPTTLKVLQEMGLSCPKDVSLASADGSAASMKELQISHVQVEYEELGRMAVRMLSARLFNRSMLAVNATLSVDFKPGHSSRIL